jgi:Tol biopolymer transport system component
MKKIVFASIILCLSFVVSLGISALHPTDDAVEINKKAERHFEKAVELISQLMYDDAISELQHVITLVPASKIAHDARYWIGQAYFRAGQLDNAMVTFEKLIKEYPESAIIPVTQLMVSRVQLEKENAKLKKATSAASDKREIIDPKTSVKYTRIRTFSGKNDKELYTDLNISPNGKFLLSGKNVVPLDGSDAFELVDSYAERGTWSPDGKMVAYYSGDAIMVIPVSAETGRPTGPPMKLIEGEYRYQSNVSWSPDGTKLVFNRRDKKFTNNVWIISLEDGSLIQITSGPETAQTPAWSPDGKRITYGVTGKDHSLWISSVDGKTSGKFIDHNRRCLPTWSPDGKWIYLTEGSVFIRLDDKKKYTFTEPEGVGEFFDWSPDGKKMLFYNSSYRWKGFLKVVSSSGGPSLEIGKDFTLWWLGPWSHDSKTITVPGENNQGKIIYYLISLLGDKSIPFNMTLSTKEGQLDASTMSLSPNGKYAALSVKKDDETEDIFVQPIPGSGAQTTSAIKIFAGYANPGATNVFSAWSPDGSKFALVHKNDIWIAYTNGDKSSQLTKTPEEKEVWLGWSPDGQIINFGTAPGGCLYTIPVSGGEVSKILDGGRNYHKDCSWSPDSKEIAIISPEQVISIIPASGGTARPIFDLKAHDIDKAWGLNWNADGNKIVFIGNRIQQEEWTSIFTISPNGENFTEITTDDHCLKYIYYFSPDGKWISYYGEGSVKMRPEASLWEADFKDVLAKLVK